MIKIYLINYLSIIKITQFIINFIIIYYVIKTFFHTWYNTIIFIINKKIIYNIYNMIYKNIIMILKYI